MIKIENISLTLNHRMILDHISCDIAPAKVTTLLGASGSGKSTLLRSIAGLQYIDHGKITLRDVTANDHRKICLSPANRKISYMFQEFSLFSHMTVLENVIFSDTSKRPKQDKILEATDILEEINISAMADYYPHQLSGGEQQRVALGAALMQKTDIILLDEPFSHLDSRLRETIRNEILAILKQKQKTIIMVTHDPQEAMMISDEMILLEAGKMVQSGTPQQIYHHPNTAYVANFLGNINILPHKDKNKSLYVRYDAIKIKTPNIPSTEHIKAVLKNITFAGDRYYCKFLSADGLLYAALRLEEIKNHAVGDSLSLSFCLNGVFVFDNKI